MDYLLKSHEMRLSTDSYSLGKLAFFQSDDISDQLWEHRQSIYTVEDYADHMRNNHHLYGDYLDITLIELKYSWSLLLTLTIAKLANFGV